MFTTNLSPYAFAKLLSRVLNKEIPPQMMYNYIKKGYIVASTNELGKKYIEVEEQVRFFEKYMKIEERVEA